VEGVVEAVHDEESHGRDVGQEVVGEVAARRVRALRLEAGGVGVAGAIPRREAKVERGAPLEDAANIGQVQKVPRIRRGDDARRGGEARFDVPAPLHQ
jgi:hypothetical protein